MSRGEVERDAVDEQFQPVPRPFLTDKDRRTTVAPSEVYNSISDRLLFFLAFSHSLVHIFHFFKK